MGYLLVRMFNHEPDLSWLLFKAGYITLGFSGLTKDLATIESIRKNPSFDNLKENCYFRIAYHVKTHIT